MPFLMSMSPLRELTNLESISCIQLTISSKMGDSSLSSLNVASLLGGVVASGDD